MLTLPPLCAASVLLHRDSTQARGKLFGEEDKFMSEVLQTTLNCVVAFLVYWLLNAALYAALFVIVELEDHGEFALAEVTCCATRQCALLTFTLCGACVPDINIGENAKALASVFGFIFSAQGMVLLPFWFRGSCCAKEGVSSSNVLIIKEQLGNSFSCRCSRNFQKKGSKYEVAPTTNSALRKEIVTYLSNGIQLLKDVRVSHMWAMLVKNSLDWKLTHTDALIGEVQARRNQADLRQAAVAHHRRGRRFGMGGPKVAILSLSQRQIADFAVAEGGHARQQICRGQRRRKAV